MPDATSVLAIGVLRELTATSLDEAAAAWRALAADLGPDALAVAGFAFRPDRAPGGAWAGFPPILVRVPELAVIRRRGRTFTITADGEADRLLEFESVYRSPAARSVELESCRDPAEWCAAVGTAAQRLREGEAEKVVLAREVMVHGDGALSAGAVSRALRTAYPNCFTYLFTGDDGTAFVGASPELLIRRQGRTATAQPMAGSVARGADDDEDDRLAASLLGTAKTAAEHDLVPRAVASVLGRFSNHIDRGQPEVVRFTNIQHLATTVRAELRDPSTSALDLAAALHPTPAVGGHPTAAALAMIDELEAMERGWYAGAVGWVDGRGNGEFAIAIRCGLLWEDGARLYAGNGIMPDSDPAAELEETEVKLRVLTGALLA